MDIHNMLNSKGSAAAAAAAAAAVSDQQLSQRVAHTFSTPHSANAPSDSDGLSDHSSEFASRSSRPIQALPYSRAQIQHSSQPDVQQSMPLLASSPDVHRTGLENGYALSPGHPENTQHSGQALTPGAGGAGDAVKAFACGTCGKGFARRSDLARHGSFMLFPSITHQYLTNVRQNVSTRVSGHMFATIRAARSNLSNVRR
ncbi:MAG: hypothetical protein Q9216_003003 [Gyalolechia sp. 2 TL-2023]